MTVKKGIELVVGLALAVAGVAFGFNAGKNEDCVENADANMDAVETETDEVIEDGDIA